jgi:inositol oxygenase
MDHDDRRSPPAFSPDVAEAWEQFIVEQVYPEPQAKAREDYRNYDSPGREAVRAFYRENHRFQTYDFVLEKKRDFLQFNRREMSVFDALEYLNTLVDDSDPDLELTQINHLLQTSEAIRAAGHPDWFVLTGLLHDLGKVLCLFGEPQWAVVGDTFPVGCGYSPRIVYSEFFSENPDATNPRYQSRCGVYEEGCGLRNVHLSWGHDEYLYQRMKDFLPEPALYMIRFHSFYAWHREGEYDWLCDDHDRAMLPWVQAFNPFDLYTKAPAELSWNALRPLYEQMINRYLPSTLAW